MQKAFSEHAAHELQTPLAVIVAQLNLLLQSPRLTADDMVPLEKIERSTKRLSALNKALLMLAKIEGNQFPDQEAIAVADLLARLCAVPKEKLAIKQLELTTQLSTAITVLMNPMLLDILLGNLLQNAIRHTTAGGKLSVETTATAVIISNTGEPLPFPEAQLFERFSKNAASAESLGLGLSICKAIATANNLRLIYTYAQNQHVFSVDFTARINP